MPTTEAIPARSIRIANFAILAAVLVFTLGQRLLAPWPLLLAWWTDLLWTAAALLPAVMALRLAPRLPAPARGSWYLIGAACAAWAAGMLIWDYEELIVGRATPFPGAADVGFLAFVPLMSLGLLAYRPRWRGLAYALLELGKLGIFVCCVVIIHITLLHTRLTTLSHDGLYLTAALAHPVLHMTLLAQVLASLWAARPGPERRVLGYLTTGIALLAVLNSLYAHALLGGEYHTGHPLDPGWFASFLLLARAALEQRRLSMTEASAHPSDEHLPHTLRVAMLGPVIALLVTAAVLVAYRDRLGEEAITHILPAAVLLFGFLALREWASNAIRDRLYATVRESQERLRRLFAASPAVTSITRLVDGRYIDVNEAFLELTGWRREEVIGRTASQIGIWAHPGQREALVERLQAAGGTLSGVEADIKTRHGELRHMFSSFEIIELDGERMLILVAIDITEQRRAQAQMHKLSRALEQTADSVMITDASGVIEYVNPAFERNTGYAGGQLLGREVSVLDAEVMSPERRLEIRHRLGAGEAYTGVFANRRRDGSLYYEEKTISPLKDAQGRVTHYITTGRDITERKQAQEQLEHLAHHDPLTGLPNRSLFLDRLDQALGRARWHRRLVAVLFIDLDRFKNINDTLGHETGDQILTQVAARLTECLRERDTVARFGGDEFVVLLDDVAEVADVGHLAEKLMHALQPPFRHRETSLHVSASVGVSLYPADGEDAGTLLQNADIAMYRAKDVGRNNCQFYSAELTARAFERLTLENHLREGLERRSFLLFYQPQVDPRSGRVHGVEALLRWRHPELGVLSPGEFIAVLEETGLIVAVERWALESACAQLAAWHAAGQADLHLSVNLSSRQFADPDFVPQLGQTLARHGISPGRLEVEITESTLMQHGRQTLSALQALKDLGVRIAVDDFGVGYSSLSYLRRFAIDTLKIDRSFVRDLPEDEDAAAIVRAITGLGSALRLRMIAEGVETAAQRDFLQALDCGLMQGFLYSRPLPPEALHFSLPEAEPGDRGSQAS